MRNSWVPRGVTLVVLWVFFAPDVAFGRIRWPERDGRAIMLHPRRFKQEHPAQIDELRDACPGQVCGNLAGGFISTLLAAAPECAQQDAADNIIGQLQLFEKCMRVRLTGQLDASKQFDSATQAKMISLAQQLRQAEKNTSPVGSVLVYDARWSTDRRFPR